VIHSLVMLGFFLAGMLAGRFGALPAWLGHGTVATWVLYVLLCLVGITVGGNGKALSLLKRVGARILIVPAATIVGTLLGAGAASLLIGLPLGESMAVGAGFGYYSLSSILIAQMSQDLPSISKSLAVIALLSNICREVLTTVAAPLLARYVDKYAPISAGGATTMDSTLAVITRYSGSEYVAAALLNGVVLTLLVPVLVPGILRLCLGGP